MMSKNIKRIVSDLSDLFPTQDKLKSVKRFLPKQTVLILAPHPDDECLMGALALRLKLENKMQVIAVATTLGSSPARQPARAKEFKAACKKLGFSSQVLPENWIQKEKKLIQLLKKTKPSLILSSHDKDFHPTHIKSAKLLKNALKKSSLDTTVAWAEFWKQQDHPNCLVQIEAREVETLLNGLMEHKGEISRNPYHLRFPGRLMDNVRRGSEWLGSFGGNAFNFAFGELYRLEKIEKKKFKKVSAKFVIDQNADASDVLST